MNCLPSVPRSSPLTLRSLAARPRGAPLFGPPGMVRARHRPTIITNAYSGSTSSTEKSAVEAKEEKSETYSHDMTQAMGAVLTYRHELGMNYNFIRPDLIVGSCLQTPSDVDKLRMIGVKTIFCLQQDSDLEYFGVDIASIQEYAKKFEDIEHCRAEIRDFDAFDLRMRLPAVVSKLHKAINRNGGVTYIHCTAGLGRAPATAELQIRAFAKINLSRLQSGGPELCILLAYMFWVQGYKLSEAQKLLLSKRPCFPKLEAIRSATADILIGLTKHHVTLTWEGDNCSSVEVSGLDIGWGQRIPLSFDKEQGLWILERELPEGRYEYKYIIDGEWTYNKHELVTSPNGDGHVNNYVHVCSNDPTIENKEMQLRLTGEDLDLTRDERQRIREFLETYNE